MSVATEAHALEVKANPDVSAADAGLRYVHPDSPGIRRVRSGKSFRYVDAKGHSVRDEDTLSRIKSLVIPPAWENVWICPSPRGHLQAIGTDVRGRKQYRYHPKWRQVRDEAKYERMISFAKVLPKLRKRVARHLKLPGLQREKVLATVVKLLETTLIRVGNEEYAKENKSFGLTTMQSKHVKVNGTKVHFEFKGKSSVQHSIDLQHPRLAKIIRQCQDLPGHELFQYVDEEGALHAIESNDVNEYLKEATGKDFTAKDFRTWAGTVLAAMALREFETFDSQTQAKKNVVAAIESVAKKLGNTKAVCRKCYVHPVVLESYMDGTLVKVLKRRAEEKIKSTLHALHPEEAAVLSMLHARLS